VFAPDSSGWGRVGNTVIRLEVADEATVKVAVATAWRNVAEVGNPSEVVDVVDIEGAREFPNETEVAEAGCAAEAAYVRIGDATEVSTTAINANAVQIADELEATDIAEVSAAKVPNGAEGVENENAPTTQGAINGSKAVGGGEKREHDRLEVWRGFR